MAEALLAISPRLVAAPLWARPPQPEFSGNAELAPAAKTGKFDCRATQSFNIQRFLNSATEGSLSRDCHGLSVFLQHE